MYEYNAKLIRYVDADTLELEIDAGFNIKYTDHFRLQGVNLPELRGEERELGLKAVNFSERHFPTGCNLRVITAKDRGKYGRWLVSIIYKHYETETWEDYLIKEGYALQYDGTGTMPRFDVDSDYPIK